MRHHRLLPPLLGLASLLAATMSAAPAGAAGDPTEDLTAPRVTLTPDRAPDGSDAWYAGQVTVTVNAVDDLPSDSGVESVAYELSGATVGTGTLPASGGTLPVSVEGVTTVRVTATDRNGNTGEATREVRIDTSWPAIGLGQLNTRTLLRQGSAVPFDYACFDLVSGIATCESTVAPGGLLDTSAIGEFDLPVTARDKVGRTSIRTLHYRVTDALHVETPAAVVGSPRVGEALTPVRAFPVEAEVQDVTCEWHRDGQPVPDRGFNIYPLGPDDLGHSINLVCSLSYPGFEDIVSASPPMTVLPGKLPEDLVRNVRLDADALQVGRSLSLQYDVGSRYGASQDDVSEGISIAWLRDGTPISGANGQRYVLQPRDAGHRIVGVVRVDAPGYEPRDFSSAPTGVVAAARAAIGVRATSPARRAVRLAVRVVADGLAPRGVLKVRRGSKVVASVATDGTTTIRLTRQPVGRVRYTVGFTGTGFTARPVDVRVRVRR